MKKRDWKIAVPLMLFGMSLMPPLAAGLPDGSDSWTTYREPNQDIQVQYPSSWFRKEHSNPPVYQLFLSREKVTKPGDIFLVGISILQIRDAANQLNLKTQDPATAASLLAASYIDNCSSPVTKRTINQPIQLGKDTGYLSNLEMRDSFGKDSQIWLVYFLHNDVLTNIILESPRAEFAQYELIFHQFLEQISLSGASQNPTTEEPFRLTREVSKDRVLIKEIGLSISRPLDWIVLQFNEPHNLITFCKQNPPSPTGPVITVAFVARLHQTGIDLAHAVILEKARLLNQKTLMKIGTTRPKKIGIWKGFEETYVFSPEEIPVSFVYFFVPTSNFLYVFTYSNKFDSISNHLADYNAVIEKTGFLNGKSSVPKAVAQKIEELQLKAAMDAVSRSASPKQ